MAGLEREEQSQGSEQAALAVRLNPFDVVHI